MADINILTGDIRGQVGQMVCQKWKNKAVIKSKPDMIWHESVRSVNARKAFEKLCRWAGTTAPYLAHNAVIYQPPLLPHNALCHWLKSWVSGGIYNPTDITALAPHRYLGWSVQSLAQSANGNVAVQFSLRPGSQPINDIVLTAIWSDAVGEIYNIVQSMSGFVPQSFVYTGDKAVPVFWHLFVQCKFKQRTIFGCLAGGSIMGVDYSQGIVLTGDTWIDGTPIKTVAITIPSVMGVDGEAYQTIIPVGATIISISAVLKATTGQQILLPFNVANSNTGDVGIYIRPAMTVVFKWGGWQVAGASVQILVEFV